MYLIDGRQLSARVSDSLHANDMFNRWRWVACYVLPRRLRSKAGYSFQSSSRTSKKAK